MLTSPTDYMNEVKAKKQVVGTWGFNSNMDFTKTSTEETNVWFFEQVFNFLRSFFGLVMPDNMEVITYNATKHIKRQNLDQQTFLDELMLVMKGLKEHIWTLRLNLNIVGFIRAQVDPDNPVRVQIQEPSSFLVWGGPDETGFQNFSISYNLFNESLMRGSDEMLWTVNQPLLEKALRKWEMQTGRVIDAVASNAGAQGGKALRHGFRRPPARGRRPMPRPRDPSRPGARPPAPARPSAQRPASSAPPRPPRPAGARDRRSAPPMPTPSARPKRPKKPGEK